MVWNPQNPRFNSYKLLARLLTFHVSFFIIFQHLHLEIVVVLKWPPPKKNKIWRVQLFLNFKLSIGFVYHACTHTVRQICVKPPPLLHFDVFSSNFSVFGPNNLICTLFTFIDLQIDDLEWILKKNWKCQKLEPKNCP